MSARGVFPNDFDKGMDWLDLLTVLAGLAKAAPRSMCASGIATINCCRDTTFFGRGRLTSRCQVSSPYAYTGTRLRYSSPSERQTGGLSVREQMAALVAGASLFCTARGDRLRVASVSSWHMSLKTKRQCLGRLGGLRKLGPSSEVSVYWASRFQKGREECTGAPMSGSKRKRRRPRSNLCRSSLGDADRRGDRYLGRSMSERGHSFRQLHCGRRPSKR